MNNPMAIGTKWNKFTLFCYRWICPSFQRNFMMHFNKTFTSFPIYFVKIKTTSQTLNST